MNDKIKKWIKYISIGITALTVLAFWGSTGYYFLASESSGYCEDGGSVAVVKMYGGMGFMDDYEYDLVSVDPVVERIDELGRMDNVETIVLEIYSTGGLPVAGEVVMNVLRRSPKKTIAMIKEDGLSSAYLAATGADKIYATRFSNVGSIGVTMSFLDSSEKNAREGLRFVSISSGEFKDMYHPDKPMTPAERQKLTEEVKETYNLFVQMVAENRNIPIEEVNKLADGSVYMGEKALQRGLIDAIGDFNTILEDLKMEGVGARVCR